MRKAARFEKIVVIVIIAVVVLFAILRISLLVKPVQLTYRDSAEMGIGEGRVFIFNYLKNDTLLRYSSVSIVPTSVPAGLQVADISSSPGGGPRSFISNLLGGYNQQTVFTLRSSPEINPGVYQLSLRLQTPLTGTLATVPVNVVIQESPDDVVETEGGPVYRADLPGETRWPPVKETTVLVGDQKVPLTYRDSIDMRSLGYKTVLLSLNASGTALEGKNVTFSVNGNNGIVIGLMSYPGNPNNEPVTAVTLDTKYPISAQLVIQVSVEGTGIIGSVPLTVNGVQSGDDLGIAPGGAMIYFAVTGGALIPPNQKTIPVP